VGGGAPVAQEVDVQLELADRRSQREHLVVELLERRPLPQQVQPATDAGDVRVDRHVAQSVGEKQHARRRLAPDARQRQKVVAGLGDRRAGRPVKRKLLPRVARGLPHRTHEPREAGGIHLPHAGAPAGAAGFWGIAEAPAGTVTPLYVHGVPTSSDEWPRFLERSGGIAPDLPGFGRSGKPGYLSFTMEEYDPFLERFLDEREIERVSLVVHDCGAVGLLLAHRLPERVERIVIINAVPLLPGYRWHRMARVWRTPGLGELAMGMTNRFTMS